MQDEERIDRVWQPSLEGDSPNRAESPTPIAKIPTQLADEQPAWSSTGGHPQSIPSNLTCLSDGSHVEWVRDSANPVRIRLMVWKDGQASIQDQVENNRQILRAPALTNSMAQALCLPAEILPAGHSNERLNANDRLNEIATILRRHVQLAVEHYLLVATFLLATWFPERVSVFPYLVIAGPTGSGKTTLLKLLRCFCRRAILLGDISPAALYRVADQVSPTLLLDECEFDGTRGSRTLRRFLRVGNASGEYVARGGELFDSSCPKIICVNDPIDDVALSTRAVHIAMLPSSNRGLEPLDKDTLDRIAAEQQSRSLMFRRGNLHRCCPLSPASAQRIETFSPKLRDITRALAVPFFADENLESELIQALEVQDEDAVLERSREPALYVVKALFADCHPPGAGETTVGSFADDVNRLRLEDGEERVLSDRKVGAVLKMLGVKTMSLGSWGRGFESTPQLRRKAHVLARQFGITRRDITNWMAVKGGYGGPTCDLCVEFGLTAGLRPSPILQRRRVRLPLFWPSELEEL